jgi:hypothetical protein
MVYSNGLPILHWTGDDTDSELYYLRTFMVDLAKCNDVR